MFVCVCVRVEERGCGRYLQGCIKTLLLNVKLSVEIEDPVSSRGNVSINTTRSLYGSRSKIPG